MHDDSGRAYRVLYAKFNPDAACLPKGIFTQAMRVRVAIKANKGHKEAYGAAAIAGGKEIALHVDNLPCNLLSHDQMVSIMHRSYAADMS